MLYVLDHYYEIDHQAVCIVIESEKKLNDIIEICASIDFLFGDLTDYEARLDRNCLLDILIHYYGAKNKKDNVSDEILNSIEMPIESIAEEILLLHDENDETFVSKAYLIDLYEARESCCGPNYKSIMNKWLPKGKVLADLKNQLLTSGIRRYEESEHRIPCKSWTAHTGTRQVSSRSLDSRCCQRRQVNWISR